MEYRVEQIARAGGVSVDTVRFYQARGLLPPPERRGRAAIYSDQHLDLLRRIRALNRQGLTLEAVRRILHGPSRDDGVKESLLGALAEVEGDRTYTRAELAQLAEVPDYLLDSAEQAGLLEPLEVEGEPRYTHSDLISVQAGTLLLKKGFPLQELLPLAVDHATHTNAITDRAIELFDQFIRQAQSGQERPSKEEVAQIFRELLPAVTSLVAVHFQRTLVRRARARLAHAGEDEALEAALAASEEARLVVSWS